MTIDDPEFFMNWIKLFAKVFNGRILLLLVMDGAIYFGNYYGIKLATLLNVNWDFAYGMKVWLVFMIVQAAWQAVIMGTDQIIDIIQSRGNKKKTRRKKNPPSSGASATG